MAQRVNWSNGSHFSGVCRWTSQLLWGLLFWKGQQVDGSAGQQVAFTFTILYMIADDARLTPPRCKKHTAYDDTRITPHHCKKHTASFARSTGKFPSYAKLSWIYQIWPSTGPGSIKSHNKSKLREMTMAKLPLFLLLVHPPLLR